MLHPGWRLSQVFDWITASLVGIVLYSIQASTPLNLTLWDVFLQGVCHTLPQPSFPGAMVLQCLFARHCELPEDPSSFTGQRAQIIKDAVWRCSCWLKKLLALLLAVTHNFLEEMGSRWTIYISFPGIYIWKKNVKKGKWGYRASKLHKMYL